MFDDLDIPACILKFHEQAQHIPFENSDFQNLAFVVSGQQTDERMKRAALLKLSSILDALRENYFQFKRDEIKLKMLEEEFEQTENQYQKELVAIDIQEMKLKSLMTQKLVQDAIHSAKYLQTIVDALPEITSREQFEVAEPGHFEAKIHRQIELSKFNQAAGSLEAVTNMTTDLKALSEKTEGLELLASRFLTPLNPSIQSNPLIQGVPYAKHD